MKIQKIKWEFVFLVKKFKTNKKIHFPIRINKFKDKIIFAIIFQQVVTIFAIFQLWSKKKSLNIKKKWLY